MFNIFKRSRWECVTHHQLETKLRQVMLAHDAFTALLGSISSRLAALEREVGNLKRSSRAHRRK